MRAIVEACKEVGAPAIIGTSEGERHHVGLLEAVALRDAFRNEYGIPVFLNADHSKSVETAKAAVDAGYDSIHIDLSAKPYEENIAGTKELIEYARRVASSKKQVVSIEGELGYLKGESKIQNEKIEVSPKDYTKPEEAKEFVASTGVDRLAIVVGNIHGISLDEPALDIERIRVIRAAVPEEVALVLHAGSGIPDDQIKAAVAALKKIDRLPPDPKDLPDAIKKELVDTGKVDNYFSDVFKRVVTMRKMVDEDKLNEVPQRDVELTREYVRRFVQNLGAIIDEQPKKKKGKK